MGRTLEERVRVLEDAIKALSGGGTTTVITTGGVQTPTPIGVLSNGQLIGTERNVNFGAGFTVTDDPGNKWVLIQPPSNSGTAGPGLLDIGAGQATGVGYTSLTATTFTALDLNEDLPIRAAAGELVRVTFQAYGTVGAGALALDVLSVNSGLYASEGTASGPGWMHWPASYTGPILPTFFMFLTAADIVNNTAILRIVYRVASGTSSLIANDADGRLKALAWNEGTAVAVPGQNTGAPPVTPPSAGVVTTLSNTARSDASSAVQTLASSSVTPAASTPVYAVAMGHIEGITAASMTSGITSGSMTDTWGGAGGTAWTLVALASLAVAAPNTNNCNFGFVFRRTVGTGPSAGTATFTRPAGTVEQEMTLSIFQVSGATEAPTQPATTSANNVSAITQTLSPVGSTSTVVAWLFNVGVSTKPGTSTLPTTGGTWTAIYNSGATIGTENSAVAYLTGGSPGNVNWTGLLSDAATSPAGVFVLDPSGATTAAPGYETFTVADKSGATADHTWVDMTL